MKKFLIVLLAILLIPTSAYAAACVSEISGNWSNAGTWTDASCGAGHYPVSGDSATIAAGHIVTIDGNITVGTSPAGIVTYNLDISGTLYWPNAPGADWTFTAQSSVRINAGGIIQIADSATPLAATDYADFLFDNAPANQKYNIYINGGKLKVYGNSAYVVSSGAVYRARIASCNPDCNAGAARTITLDRNINWAASASVTHDAILIGVGGNETTSPAAGDDPEMITSWGSPAANQINGVTLVENHAVGDIVVNASRNVLFLSDGATYHSYVYTSAASVDPYDINWVRFDEFGDGVTSTTSGVGCAATANNLGTINYVAVTNAEDGGNASCFFVDAASWTKFEGNTCFDTRAGAGFGFGTGTSGSTWYDAKDLSYFASSLGNGNGFNFAATITRINLDGAWATHGAININNAGAVVNVKNSLSHYSTGVGISMIRHANWMSFISMIVSGNEIRNILTAATSGLLINGGDYAIDSNNIDNIQANCMYAAEAANIYSHSNTFDNCNVQDSTSYAALYIGLPTGFYYGYNENFGGTTVNKRSNIIWVPRTYSDSPHTVFNGVCNYCLFADPSTVTTCGVMPTDGIYLNSCVTGDQFRVFISDGSFFTLHDKDRVAGTHVGWGPGGSVISKEAVVVVDNTLNFKIQPGSATEYAYVKVGQIYARVGDTVTVNIQLRKDENQSAGFRPRIALEGCGFNRITNYSEMSDLNNTWETQTVTGVATYAGSVEVFVAARNNLTGANGYTEVWPPTLEVYADGFDVTSAP